MTIVHHPTGRVGSHAVRMLCQVGVRPRLLHATPTASTRCVIRSSWPSVTSATPTTWRSDPRRRGDLLGTPGRLVAARP